MDKRECRGCPYILDIQEDVRELKEDRNNLYRIANRNTEAIAGIVTTCKVMLAIATLIVAFVGATLL